MQRSSSWGNYGGGYPSGGYSVPRYAMGDVFDEQNLARRPRDWRPDYEPRASLTSYLPRVGRSRSDVAGMMLSLAIYALANQCDYRTR